MNNNNKNEQNQQQTRRHVYSNLIMLHNKDKKTNRRPQSPLLPNVNATPPLPPKYYMLHSC